MYKHISELIVRLEGCLLDIGCDTKPYQSICNVKEYIGLEIDCPETRSQKIADGFYDGKVIPYENKDFDCLLSNQVFEHVLNPEKLLSEMNRVLKLEGLMLMTVPLYGMGINNHTTMGSTHLLA